MSFWPRPATESVVLIHSLLGESKRWHFHLTSSFSWIFYSGRNVFSQIEWLDEESVMSNTAWNCPMQNKTISKNGDCTHAMNNTDTFPTHEDGHMYTQAYIFTFSIGLTCSYTITHKQSEIFWLHRVCLRVMWLYSMSDVWSLCVFAWKCMWMVIWWVWFVMAAAPS